MARPADATWLRPAVVALAVLTTLVSLLGGVGVLPTGPASATSSATECTGREGWTTSM